MRNEDGGGRGGAPGRGVQGRGVPGRTGRRPLVWEDARWRRDQIARRRRLTRRGRITIAGLLALGFATFVWIAEPLGPVRGATASRPSAEPPASGRAAAHVASAPLRAPRAVLENPPFTRAALELPETPPGTRPAGRLLERRRDVGGGGVLEVEYTLSAELMREVFEVLRRGRVALGNVVVMEPESGRVLAYAATDPKRFPPTRAYPAASLVKVITAAAALDEAPELARLPCRFTGSPYRLTPSRIDPPARGNEVSLRRALATSNNQCLAQLAVHAIGVDPLMRAIGRFGWLDPPAPAHAAGEADPGEEVYDLGRLGSGLAGSRITPLHAAQLAATLVHGELVAPRWVERVATAEGRELDVPAPPAPRRVLSPRLTDELRGMLVDTTRTGTARRAFRKRSGRPLLGSVAVAGKTGSLSGREPDGRYEWFIGVAPADAPRIAIATLLVQSELWWRSSSQIAADILRNIFCDRRTCRAENASRFLRGPRSAALANAPEERGGARDGSSG